MGADDQALVILYMYIPPTYQIKNWNGVILMI